VDALPIVLVFVAIAAVAAIVAYFGWKAEHERRRALAGVAQRLGFRFDPDDDADHDALYAQFEIFQHGHARVTRNTLTGSIDLFGRPCRVRCGDFRYKTRSGGRGGSRTIDFSYVLVQSPWDAPAALVIRPEGISDKMDAAFGSDDIDFESVEFSKLFHVASSDRRFAYDVLHPRMMEYLLAERPPMFVIASGALCLGDGERTWITQAFARQIAFVQRIAELWPRHLAKGLKT
jgi:hypothetical protein